MEKLKRLDKITVAKSDGSTIEATFLGCTDNEKIVLFEKDNKLYYASTKNVEELK